MYIPLQVGGGAIIGPEVRSRATVERADQKPHVAREKAQGKREGSDMRQLRYSVASSLDGFIAGPSGEYDWIVIDPDIDFAAMYAAYGGLVMGRKSYEVAGGTEMPGPRLPIYVYSRTLPEGDRQGVTFVRDAVPHL